MLVLAAKPLTTHCRETDRTTAQGAGLSIAWDGYFKSTGQRMSQDNLEVGLGGVCAQNESREWWTD